MILHRAGLLVLCVSLSAAVRLLTGPPLNCSQQGLRCTATTNNCMDKTWLNVNEYTPSSPEDLQVSVDTRRDDEGHLHPVLLANWTLKDEGSICFVKATELHILVLSTNQNLCVRYTFKDKLPMQSRSSGKKWSFSADRLVLEPGQRYRVSVFNIPKPELGHSSYDVSRSVIVPECEHPSMQRTQFCIDRGSLWQPNISLSAVSRRSELTMSFTPDRLCADYIVMVKCSTITHTHQISSKANQTTLNVTFSLDKWPRSCCRFDAEIKPLFPQCGTDCTRRRRTLDVCPEPTPAPDAPVYTFVIYVIMGVVFACVVMAVIMYIIYRRPGKRVAPIQPERGEKPWRRTLQQTPKVLVIYSQDHHLYRDIVLKLCAFLQAKCGTKVLVDLLDSSTVGMVGGPRWLEWQRQQLKNPTDKILVLCSQGVQAKWRAMCGQERVTLREDILSPNDDIVTPFLNLFLPNMHQAGMLGKYMVAYFDDISSEQDVPSVFDIAVKYKLMKHFEELYFRILDMEKYEPGQVNQIEGIGRDEYFNCQSGRALRNAIETFQAYQVENPDWFERECVASEEEVIMEANMLIDEMQIPPVLEYVPLIRDGLPVYTREVEINENGNSVHVLTPELNTEREVPSVAELTPIVNSGRQHQYPSNQIHVPDHMYPYTLQSIYVGEPVLIKPPPPRENWLYLEKEPLGQIPTEDEEEDSLLPMSQISTHSDQKSSALENSGDSDPPETSRATMQSECFPPCAVAHSQPVEMEEYEVLEPSVKVPSGDSDQGYISKIPSQHEPGPNEDPLAALRRLQEELFQRNLRYCDMGPDGN